MQRMWSGARALMAVAAALLAAVQALAGELDGGASGAAAGEGVMVTLALDRRVPYRLFTLTDPDRLVVDLHGITGGRVIPERFRVDGIAGARFGLFAPDRGRLVLDLSAPMALRAAAYREGGGTLVLTLRDVSPEDFAATSGMPDWQPAAWPPPPAHDGRLRIAIDAGHGGVDPGAIRDGILEKDIVMEFALEFEALARQDGRFSVYLTRDGDHFVSLADRVERAREAGADLFVSVHADTVETGHASGASVHTLSEEASDPHTAEFAARENGSDAAAGLDTRGELDAVQEILADMASVETNARSRDFADRLVGHLAPRIGVLATRPHRSGRFSVLKAHDMPSVLFELGFLSTRRDRDALIDPAWRREAAEALLAAIADWAAADRVRLGQMYR